MNDKDDTFEQQAHDYMTGEMSLEEEEHFVAKYKDTAKFSEIYDLKDHLDFDKFSFALYRDTEARERLDALVEKYVRKPQQTKSKNQKENLKKPS